MIKERLDSMRFSEKSVAFLIDELITTSMKCWHAQEVIMDESLTETQRLDGAIRAQQMNARRNALMRAIDERLGEGDRSVTEKTYTYFEDKK